MLGKITSFEAASQSGTIESEGQSYQFSSENWIDDVVPEVGDDVRFDNEDDKAVNVGLVGINPEKPAPVKYKYLAAALSLFFGWAGLGRFYLGFYKIGLYQIALSAILLKIGMFVFVPQWGFVEALLLASSKMDRDAKGRPLK